MRRPRKVAEFGIVQLQQVAAVEVDPAAARSSRCSASRPMVARARVDFPGTALADHADDAAARNRQADIAQGMDRPARGSKINGQILDLEQRRRGGHQTMRLSLGSSMSRRHSPRKVKPSVVRISGMPRGDHDPGRLADQIVSFVERAAPARGRRRHAEPEEAQARLQRDHRRNIHAGDDQQGTNDIRQQVAQHDAKGTGAQGALGQDEFGALQRKGLRAHQPRIDRRRGNDHDQHDGCQAGAQQRDDRQRQHHRGKGIDRVEQQQQRVVEPARAVARQHAKRQAEDQRDGYGADADDERDLAAFDDAAEDVATHLIGAGEMGQGECLHAGRECSSCSVRMER